MATVDPGYQFVEAVLQDAAVAAGDGDTLVIGGLGNLVIQVEGITTATITPKVSNDGSTWYTAELVDLTDASVDTSITADGIWRLRNMGPKFFMADITAYTAGTITVTAIGSPNGSGSSSD